MGLLVDVVKQRFRTTNDGNTARKCFDNFELSSQITGLDKTLIKQFCTLMQAISTGSEINADAFQKHCNDTLDNFLKNCAWFYSMHKLLIQGPNIIKNALPSIIWGWTGILSQGNTKIQGKS